MMRKAKKYYLLAMIALAVTVSVDAQIHTVDHMAGILPLVHGKQTDHAELVVFDIDGTLLRAVQTEATDEWARATYNNMLEHGMPRAEAKATVIAQFMRAQSTSPVIPVDPAGAQIIGEIAKKQVAEIALTARGSKTDWIAITQRQLTDVGIDFALTSRQWQEPFQLPELRGNAFYHGGIIFSDCNDKGTALELFCQKTGFWPTHIIFVDDLRENVVAVEKFAQKYHIDFDGVYFVPTQAPVIENVAATRAQQ